MAKKEKTAEEGEQRRKETEGEDDEGDPNNWPFAGQYRGNHSSPTATDDEDPLSTCFVASFVLLLLHAGELSVELGATPTTPQQQHGSFNPVECCLMCNFRMNFTGKPQPLVVATKSLCNSEKRSGQVGVFKL